MDFLHPKKLLLPIQAKSFYLCLFKNAENSKFGSSPTSNKPSNAGLNRSPSIAAPLSRSARTRHPTRPTTPRTHPQTKSLLTSPPRRVHSSSLLPQFLQAVLRESMDKQDISRWQKVFPLNLQRKFAWHPDVVSFCPPTQRHQIVMMRVREEIIAGALRELCKLLGQSVVSAKHTLRSTLKQIITALEQLRLNAPLLQLLTELPSSSALSPKSKLSYPSSHSCALCPIPSNKASKTHH